MRYSAHSTLWTPHFAFSTLPSLLHNRVFTNDKYYTKIGKGGGEPTRLRWQLNQLWPCKDMLCVRRCSDAGPAGTIRCWQLQCREHKIGSKRFNSITKSIHVAQLGILFIYGLHSQFTFNLSLSMSAKMRHVHAMTGSPYSHPSHCRL